MIPWQPSGYRFGLIDYLLSILELDVVDDKFQLLNPPDFPPVLLGALEQVEYYRQGRVAQATVSIISPRSSYRAARPTTSTASCWPSMRNA